MTDPGRVSLVFSAWSTVTRLNFIETEGAPGAFAENLSRI